MCSRNDRWPRFRRRFDRRQPGLDGGYVMIDAVTDVEWTRDPFPESRTASSSSRKGVDLLLSINTKFFTTLVDMGVAR
jgi:hypothetical protein